MRGAPLLTGVAVLALAVALGACGKRAGLRAPDDASEAYTYPRQYPNPGTVLPQGDAPPRRSREVTSGAGDISPLPNSRTTKTYGDPGAP